MIHPRIILYALFLASTWEGVLYATISGVNVRPYQLFLVLGFVLVFVRRSIAFGMVGLLLCAYVLAGVPSLLNSVAPSDSVRTLFFSGVMVLIALVVRSFLRTRRAVERAILVWILVIGNLVNVLGLLQVVTWVIGAPISPHFAPAFYPLYRPYSFFIEPNFYGNFLAGQLAILVVLWLTPAYKRWWPLLALSSLPAFFLLALNQSRGPWVALALVLLLLVIVRYLRRLVIPLRLLCAMGLGVLAGLVLIVAGLLVVPDLAGSFLQRLRDTINPLQEGAASDRVYDILLSAEAMREHPWIGNGVGTWGYYVGREGRDVRTPPRNLVVAWLFEKGVVGALAGFLLFLTLFVRTALALRWADAELRSLIWASFLGWLAVFVTFQFTVLEISPFYWVLMGMLLSATDLGLAARFASLHAAPASFAVAATPR